jgi:hypothetical protein
VPTGSTANLVAAPLLTRNDSYGDESYQMADLPSRVASPAMRSPGGYVNVAHHDRDNSGDLGGGPNFYQQQSRF